MNASTTTVLLDKINRAIKRPDFPALSRIEYDLLLQHISRLYDCVDSLRLNQGTAVSQNNDEIISTTNGKTESGAPVTGKVFLANTGLLLNDVPEKEKPGNNQEFMVANAKAALSTPAEEKNTNTGTLAISINESIQTSESLNEKLKPSIMREVHRNLASKPLKELIGLNHRFVILNGLFNGDAEAFTRVVSHIDSLNDYTNADSFIQTQVRIVYNWEASPQPVNLFMKLVKQKFGVE